MSVCLLPTVLPPSNYSSVTQTVVHENQVSLLFNSLNSWLNTTTTLSATGFVAILSANASDKFGALLVCKLSLL